MKQDKLVIYGNGQMATMMYEILKNEYNIVAFTTDNKCINTSLLKGLPLIPFETIDASYSPSEHVMLIAVGYSDMNELRIDRGIHAKQKGFELISYISPNATLYGNTSLGENCIVLEYSSIHPNTTVNDFVFIGSHTNIGHDCEIQNGNWINAGVCIGGATKLKESCFVGMNATIGHNITIGEKCYIGAQALVTKSTDPTSVHIAPNAERLPLTSQDFLNFIS